MLTFLAILNFILMIALPLILVVFLIRRFGLSWGLGWRLVGVGALTFIASQIVHIPLLLALTAVFKQVLPDLPPAAILPFNAVVLGLMAGLCEEIARYVVYRFFLKDARTWPQALVFGAGHGGVEAVIFGVLAGLTTLQMIVLHNTDPNAWGVPAAQLPAVQQQVATFWASPWYAALLGAVERVFAICFHLSAAVLVMQAFTRRNIGWLGLAILWHTLVDGVAVYASGTWGIYWTEALVAVSAVISLAIIFALRDRPAPLADAERLTHAAS
jgi:uncharacterized membrane protein YhfC